MLIDPDSNYRKGWVCDVPPEVIVSLPDQHKYIAYGEAFAPMSAMRMLSPKLRNTAVMFYIDNLAVLSSLVVGNSRVLDHSWPVYTTQLYVAFHRIKVWFEYVDSLANLSAGGSRDGVSYPVAAANGVELTVFPWLCNNKIPLSLEELTSEIIGKVLSA